MADVRNMNAQGWQRKEQEEKEDWTEEGKTKRHDETEKREEGGMRGTEAKRTVEKKEKRKWRSGSEEVNEEDRGY